MEQPQSSSQGRESHSGLQRSGRARLQPTSVAHSRLEQPLPCRRVELLVLAKVKAQLHCVHQMGESAQTRKTKKNEARSNSYSKQKQATKLWRDRQRKKRRAKPHQVIRVCKNWHRLKSRKWFDRNLRVKFARKIRIWTLKLSNLNFPPFFKCKYRICTLKAGFAP